MALTLRVRSGSGVTEATEDSVSASKMVAIGQRAGLPYLSGVDWYGLTWFNSRQIPMLLADLDRLTTAAGSDPEVAAAVDAVRRLSEIVVRTPHRFLVFVGD